MDEEEKEAIKERKRKKQRRKQLRGRKKTRRRLQARITELEMKIENAPKVYENYAKLVCSSVHFFIDVIPESRAKVFCSVQDRHQEKENHRETD